MENVLVPALVAAFVTMLIEYVAKPNLEVRKERILERHRDRRILFRAFGSVYYRLGKMSVVLEADGRDPRATEIRDLLREGIESFEATFAERGAALTSLQKQTLVHFVGAVNGMRTCKTDAQFDRLTDEWLIPLAHAAYTTQTIRRWQRRRIALVRRVVADVLLRRPLVS